MDSTKLILIFGISLIIYFAFMFLGFFLKNKNLKAQNLKKDWNPPNRINILDFFLKIYIFLGIFYGNKI